MILYMFVSSQSCFSLALPHQCHSTSTENIYERKVYLKCSKNISTWQYHHHHHHHGLASHLSMLSLTPGILVPDKTDTGEIVREQCLQGNVMSGVVVEVVRAFLLSVLSLSEFLLSASNWAAAWWIVWCQTTQSAARSDHCLWSMLQVVSDFFRLSLNRLFGAPLSSLRSWRDARQESGRAAIFHTIPNVAGIRERRSREWNSCLPHLVWFLLAAHL